jgi:hypothetical protein
VYVTWSDGNGITAMLRSRELRVELDDTFLEALRKLVGPDHVRLVKA